MQDVRPQNGYPVPRPPDSGTRGIPEQEENEPSRGLLPYTKESKLLRVTSPRLSFPGSVPSSLSQSALLVSDVLGEGGSHQMTSAGVPLPGAGGLGAGGSLAGIPARPVLREATGHGVPSPETGCPRQGMGTRICSWYTPPAAAGVSQGRERRPSLQLRRSPQPLPSRPGGESFQTRGAAVSSKLPRFLQHIKGPGQFRAAVCFEFLPKLKTNGKLAGRISDTKTGISVLYQRSRILFSQKFRFLRA